MECLKTRMNTTRQNWQLFSKNMSNDIIEHIIGLAGETQKASTFNDGDTKVRSSRVCWLSHYENVKDMLFAYADHANQNAFNVILYKKADIQFTEYHASEGGHYDWHHDVNWLNADGFDRKLSITVQLSDPSEYEGGDFVFEEIESPKSEAAKPKGSVLVFPSYLKHKVTPVTKGVRKSLVAWFCGPQWQ